jgi:hypothetical protein
MFDHKCAHKHELVNKKECRELIEKGIQKLWSDEEVKKVGMDNDAHPEYQLQNSKYQQYDFNLPDTNFNINCFE